MIPLPPSSTRSDSLLPYTTHFRSRGLRGQGILAVLADRCRALLVMRSVRMRGTVLLAGLLLALPLSAAAAPAPTAVAVFDVELYDTSLEGELRGRDPAESARLGQITAQIGRAHV